MGKSMRWTMRQSPNALVWTHEIGGHSSGMIHEPLAALLVPGPDGPPAAVASRAARALLDLPPVSPATAVTPAWLAAHQRPAAVRLAAIISRYGGAVLADAPGLGKSYVAMAVALMCEDSFTL